jgi:hypothetical protein
VSAANNTVYINSAPVLSAKRMKYDASFATRALANTVQCVSLFVAEMNCGILFELQFGVFFESVRVCGERDHISVSRFTSDRLSVALGGFFYSSSETFSHVENT